MADELPRVSSMAFFYGPIVESALGRMTTQAMWEQINAAAEAAGVRFPPDALQQVNDLRANAASVARASRELQGAPASDAITSQVIGQPIYARPLESQGALSQFEARFRLVFQTPAGQDTQWVRIVYGADLPDTVGQLTDELDAYAQDLAAGYSQQLVSWDSPMLNAI